MVENKPIGKPARNKWIKATEDPSLSPGKRIRSFCEISRQADKILEEDKTENAEETIRSEIAKLCSSTASKARINEQQVGQYLRLCYLSNDEVRKLAKDADCNDPIEKPEEKPRYCSRMSISHALLLAAVENKERREQLLVEAIANHWPHKVLKAESSADRINSLDYRRKLGSDELLRHRTLVGKLTATTATLLDLLAQLDDDSFVETIAKSREDRADTVKLLNELDSTFEVIRKKLPAAKKAAKAAAKKLNKVVVKK